ncbi:ABC transporter permease [Afifella sp. IM 167]|uniref:ABC transporter permease n=2 Tax=Pseudomonadota TaxID=1224 RepID=UPI001CCC89F6|nr:ABC transporter permease [Afifella sp. IM 167]MBZ8132789.1 glycosyl transferase family 1 [Afifella sp. IM 167]
MSALPTPLRFAARELRGGFSGFYVFLACIALGVAAIAGVNSVSRALTEGIAHEGRTILGGDISFSLIHREASPEEYAFLKEEAAGEPSLVANMRAMARRLDGADQTLVELKAVGPSYPDLGELQLRGGGDLGGALARVDGMPGAVAAPELMDRLGLVPGDRIALGSATLQIRGVVEFEPDRLSDGIGFGPRLLVSRETLRETGLVRPGSLVTYEYRLILPGASDQRLKAIREAAEARFPDAGWRIRARDNASPRLTDNITRFAQFLTLVGLTALVVGGVGVANAVASFVDLKRPAIATLKCLGAPRSFVFRTYLLQILILAAFGIAVGLVIGAALPFAAIAGLKNILPVAAVPAFYPRELVLAALYGFLVALAFSLWPLGRARDLPAASLFADRAAHFDAKPAWSIRIAQLVLLFALAGIAILLSVDQEVALFFVLGVVIAFLILRVIAIAVMAAARNAGTIRSTTLRLAIRNIQRPGALTASVVLSLGLGLTLLVTLALIDTNLRSQLTGRIAEKAPDFFFVDIQGAERQPFLDLLAEVAPEGRVQTVPMLRGRLVELNGVPASEVQAEEGARWVLRGDRGITYSDEMPKNSELEEGEWWPADYSGEPLVSFDGELARGLGLKLGDTVTVNVLGRNLTARIANFRSVEWESLAINFVMVFTPNTFSGAPHTHLATLTLPEGSPEALSGTVLREVTDAFPGVTSVRVKDAIEAVNSVVRQLALAVRIAASLALLVSMLVLAGALAAGHRQRRQDAVILKALGATRRQLLSAFALEYGLLGLATGLFALAAGSGAAWFVISGLMDFDFTHFPWIAAASALIALVVTVGLGLAGTWRILSVRPAPYLRNL